MQPACHPRGSATTSSCKLAGALCPVTSWRGHRQFLHQKAAAQVEMHSFLCSRPSLPGSPPALPALASPGTLAHCSPYSFIQIKAGDLPGSPQFQPTSLLLVLHSLVSAHKLFKSLIKISLAPTEKWISETLAHGWSLLELSGAWLPCN